MSKKIIHTYFSHAMNVLARRTAVNKVVAFIRSKEAAEGTKINGVIASGISGITMASMVAYEMDIDLVIVRKDNEKHHSSHTVEGLRLWTTEERKDGEMSNLVLIDDFIESGATVKRIQSTLDSFIKEYRTNYGGGMLAKAKILYGIMYEGFGSNQIIDGITYYTMGHEISNCVKWY